MSATESQLIDDVRGRFEEQGYAILRRLIEPDVVEGVRSALYRWVDERAGELIDAGATTDALAAEPFATRLVKLYADRMDQAPGTLREELHWPGMFGLFFAPRLLDVVEALLGPEIRLYPNYSVRPKFPDDPKTEVLWHQDAGYTDTGVDDSEAVSGLRMVNCWTPLVPARVANGCMQFVPGTHKLGVVAHVNKRHYLEIAPEILDPRRDQAVDVELDPGDVVIFSNLLFHRGLPNRTDTMRWSCDWRYQDATQPTLRQYQGHLARSRQNPDKIVGSAEQWAQLSFV